MTRQFLTLFMVAGLSVPCLAQSHINASGGENPCAVGWAEPPRVDPRNPDVICLPELGRMTATSSDRRFGQEVHSIGKIGNDSLASWTANCHCGGSWTDLLLYRGVDKGLPTFESGQRIGPTERNSDTRLLAAGDFDADGYTDLVCRIQIDNDSSFGITGAQISRVVVFWGSINGLYSINDTSRLSGDAEGWAGPYDAITADLDGDRVLDICVWSWVGQGVSDGQIIPVPKVFIYRGQSGQRWGRNRSRSADWRWWNPPPPISQLGVGDQDGNGVFDVYLYDNEHSTSNTGMTSVLYGNAGTLPDTNQVETVDLKIANGHYALLEDITGDKVPELIMTCGTENQIKVFIGSKGQRLKEQYGTGFDAPQPGAEKWWGKPWATIWQPHRINDFWFESQEILLDLGDGSGEGIGDVWSISWPYVLLYGSGARGDRLDSLVEAMVDIRPGAGVIAAARLGDIDGSGRSTIAISYDKASDANFPGGIVFVQPSLAVSQSGRYRQLPDGSGPASVRVTKSHLPSHLTIE